MSRSLSATDLVSILRAVAESLSGHSDEVRKLDAALGDGDMGVTLELGSRALTEYLESATGEDIGELLSDCGRCFRKASPSTFGTLLASAFAEAGRAVSGRTEIGVDDLVPLGKSAIEGIKRLGKAEEGEKTMLDTLVPAVRALEAALAEEAAAEAAIESALQAARTGMEATQGMRAKHSRASWRQDGGLGVQDAGATAVYYLVEAAGRGVSRALSG
ncbi:MAG: DAK2 domain-containing protein [Armatimonadetes bacterium]|nr:DAK2 domain-containing protein [Armatimonadota bacterium]